MGTEQAIAAEGRPGWERKKRFDAFRVNPSAEALPADEQQMFKAALDLENESGGKFDLMTFNVFAADFNVATNYGGDIDSVLDTWRDTLRPSQVEKQILDVAKLGVRRQV